LRARFLERQVQWRSELAAELAARAGVDPEVDMRPALVAGIALTAFDTALTRWIAASGTERFSDLVDQAFDLVAPALVLPVDHGVSALDKSTTLDISGAGTP